MTDVGQYINVANSLAAANNSWSAAQAQKQMDFQREMSNTAHQREVADLKAAGLNPVLSANGNGASTPNGAIANVDNSNVQAFVELMKEFGSTIAQASASGAAGGSTGHSLADPEANSAEKIFGLFAEPDSDRQRFGGEYTNKDYWRNSKNNPLYPYVTFDEKAVNAAKKAVSKAASSAKTALKKATSYVKDNIDNWIEGTKKAKELTGNIKDTKSNILGIFSKSNKNKKT